MKKILTAILAAAVVCTSLFALAGCGNSSKNSESKSSGSSSSEKGELHMATNASFEPYEYQEGGKVVGIDAEIAQAICDKLGYKLVIDDMEFDAIITAVTSGKADFGMAGMTVTDERKKSVDFTDPYTNAIQAIIVNESDSKVSSKKDLEGATVGVQLGTTGDVYVTDVKDAKVERFSKGADAVLAITQNKGDAVVFDNEPATTLVEQNKGRKIEDK